MLIAAIVFLFLFCALYIVEMYSPFLKKEPEQDERLKAELLKNIAKKMKESPGEITEVHLKNKDS